MLVACRLAGLSALEAYYAGVRARAQFGSDALCHGVLDITSRRKASLRTRRATAGPRSGHAVDAHPAP